MEASRQLHSSATLSLKERTPVTHWIGGRVNPRAGLGGVEKKKISPSDRNQLPFPIDLPIV